MPVTPARGVRANLASVFRHPGTRLGMWTHWSTSFAPMVFGLMWGFPYLTQGEGLAKPTASLLIGLLAVVGVIVGPILGLLVQRHPLRRSNLVLAMVAAGLVPWLLVLAWPGPAPLWLLITLCVGLAAVCQTVFYYLLRYFTDEVLGIEAMRGMLPWVAAGG